MIFFKLKKYIDEQLGCVGIYQRCEYTKTHQRNHFLKSKDDAWQQEYRIFWDTVKHCNKGGLIKEIWVDVPKNAAKFVKL